MNRARVLTVFFSGAGCWRIDLIDGFVGLNLVLCFVWREDFLPFDAYFFWIPLLWRPFFLHISSLRDANFPEKTCSITSRQDQVFVSVK